MHKHKLNLYVHLQVRVCASEDPMPLHLVTYSSYACNLVEGTQPRLQVEQWSLLHGSRKRIRCSMPMSAFCIYIN